MLIPTSVAAYRRGDLPHVVLCNYYAEKATTVPGQVVLFPRPGMALRYALTDQPVRGIFQQSGLFGGDIFAISNNLLYRGNAGLGALAASSQAQFAATDTQMLIAADRFSRYDGSAIFAINFPDGASVSSVTYLGGYAIAARAGSRRFYFTADPATWDGLDYLSAEQSTDPIVGIAVVVDQLWVFCERHTEIFFTTGDADAPFQRVQGRVFDKGAKARDTIVQLDNTVFWVGDDGIVYRGENTPLRISDHGVEEQIANSQTASAWSFAWNGHLFYVLQLESSTWVYDVATGLWTTFESFDCARWRGGNGVQIGSVVAVADCFSGNIWTLLDGRYADGDDVMSRTFTILNNTSMFVDNLQLDCSAGELPSPTSAPGVMELRTSRDGGMTWQAWRQEPLGAQGHYRQSVRFSRLGLIDRSGMVTQIRVTDPVISRISYVRINETGGGRSR